MLSSGAISRLYIANANRQDSGNYSCGKCSDTSSTIHLGTSVKRLNYRSRMFERSKLWDKQKRSTVINISFYLSLKALGDLAQATVMVHVLIGKWKTFIYVHYLKGLCVWRGIYRFSLLVFCSRFKGENPALMQTSSSTICGPINLLVILSASISIALKRWQIVSI